ncbi:MAG: hypothetical protein DKM50_03665 [Candidatus Margulisiibacteriota bacterium]|nr:MAG: hypothetical protein A2X43_07960 [Candidatus Margulisbacteria bacterium GWD2_39_127]OGI03661.1 MAG: hypothetical protein A2X42_06440 [Candidatus Margulisbacteria bacterium GWF2_38_17]OGI05653.1 MAG: hypothetical protein A2X41_03490 [Candidatus Margulisbacteria bacterium GWE2_39_32]PZM82234.1 MAG: hypothetical protein DKM50_03665 [Candidatus Margulisiibacteriota bacterium]HAR63724.1 hypothetical protein [Candidatus Margulisiibacteriota bacterium]
MKRKICLILFVLFVSTSFSVSSADNNPQQSLTVNAIGAIAPTDITSSNETEKTTEKLPPVEKSSLVKEVKIMGNKLLSREKIAAYISTCPGEPINEIKLQKDVQVIKDTGYFQEVIVKQHKTPEGIVVDFAVEENPVVKKIEFEGNTLFSSKDLSRLMSTKENEILNYNDVRDDMKTIESYYHDKGFSIMKVVNITTPVPGESNSVVFTIVEGVIEKVLLEGNNNTHDNVILRELKMKPGDVFNQEMLMADGRRIFNLNYFTNVVPKPFPGSDSNSIVIVWSVEEKKTSAINLGGSFGSSQEFSFFVDLNLDNFNGNAELISLKGEWGKKITSYQLKYHNPWIGKERTSFTARLWNTDSQFDDYDYGKALRRGGDLVFGRELSEAWDASVKTKLERVEPKDTNSNYNIFMLGGSLSYDTRDYWMNPSKGDYYSFSLENNNNLFGVVPNAVNMTKYFINIQNFFPVVDKQVIATRLSWGEIYGDIKDKDPERLFIGGGTTVRGFTDTKPFARGSRRLLGSAEYRITFNDMFQGVLFYDFGKMGEVDSKNVNFEGDNSWHSGFGFGFRINSPLGPIRLDFGWTDPKGNLVDTETNEREYSAIHFNIGHAF